MAISVTCAAKRMCERSGWSISNLALQKILYLAHMYHLGEHNAPLISGHFEAWDYGPVQPIIYHKLKIFGASPVRNIFRSVRDIEDGSEREMLDAAVEQLANAALGKLVTLTHWEKGAWAKNYIPGVRSIEIPDEDIKQEYDDRKVL